MSLTAFPGKGEQGVSVRYRGNTPIGYCLIDENGKYADYWYFIGKIPSQDSWLCHYDGDDEVNAPYMYIKFSQDKQQVNLLKSITSYFEIINIYHTTKNNRSSEIINVPGFNFDELNINVDNSSESKSRSNSRSTCSSCGGTGVDRAALSHWGGVSSYLGYYNSSGSRCPYCNRMDQHYHSKCTKCNTPRY